MDRQGIIKFLSITKAESSLLVETSTKYPLILATLNPSLYIWFYDVIYINPLIKDFPMYRVNLDDFYDTVLLIGPIIEYNKTEYITLETRRDFSPYSVKFVDIRKSKLSPLEILFTFEVTNIFYNPTTGHIIMLEHAILDWFSNKVLIKSINNLPMALPGS